MNDIKKIIFKDISNIIKLLKSNKSISIYPYLLSDLEQLQELCDDLGIEGYQTFADTNISLNYQKYNDNIINTIAGSYLIDYDFTFELLSNITEFYNSSPLYKMYDDETRISLQLEEILELVMEFLHYFDDRYLETFYKVFNEKKLIVAKPGESDALGMTYNGYKFSPYIIFENRNSLVTVATIIHEVAHAFSTYLIKNIEFKKQNNRYLINTIEICSYTTEFFFIEYLEKEHILTHDTKRLINEFNHYLQDNSLYLFEEFSKGSDNLDITDEIQSVMKDFYGRALAPYLVSLNDKEKALYLIDRISIESCEKPLTEILKDNNMDIEDIASFSSASKVLKRVWK